MIRSLLIRCLPLLLIPLAGPAGAYQTSVRLFDKDVGVVLNNTVTFGASWRLQDQASDLISKGAIDPDLCSGQFQTCQGLFREQTFPAARLAAAPGQASINFDDGNLNYDRGDLVQMPLKYSHDFRFTWDNYGIFIRGIGIYDHHNYDDFETFSPNKITSANVNDVGVQSGNRTSNRYFDQVFGPGGVVREQRARNEAEEIGLRYDLLDANFFANIPLDDIRTLNLRIGRQTVNWGQSTVAVVNSVNQAQPVNTNSLYRLGFGLLEELFVPVNMVRASTEIFGGITMEAYYQLEWEPIEIPTAGSFMSFVDIGTDNQRNTVNLAFGQAPDDPEFLGNPLDNPLTLITGTALTAERLPDRDARDSGQYGVSFKYYADNINNGTEFGVYFMNYHSKLPYVSFFSTDASCARAAGNAQGIDARNTSEFFTVCPNLPTSELTLAGQAALLGDVLSLTAQRPGIGTELGLIDGNVLGLANLLLPRPGLPTSSAVPFDTAKLQLEYPEDIRMFGADFTTTYGEYSFQGEVSYRPNVPLQVALIDVAFSAFGPVLSSCHNESVGCFGTSAGLGFNENGDSVIYEGNDFVVDNQGTNPFPDTINLAVGAVPGSARSFPSFLIPWRYGADAIGNNAPNSYIQGWIPGKVAQYNLGATRVLGPNENWIGADQVILIYEFAGTHVLNMPDFDELQIEGPLTAYTHASAGADGTGADGSRLACSTNPTCSLGADGLRFNPTQAPRNAYADAFSWGYRIVGRIAYESVLPGISVQPLFIWAHDINGNSPGPAGNFVEGRKALNLLLETRYGPSYAFTIAYNTFFGAGSNNLYRDRDNLGFFFKYQF